ncbi:MAG: hypothetical protein M3069_14435 [Chloroflexota bacterium]|nr:hypothetical protein [Chloroflexota bacterium]
MSWQTMYMVRRTHGSAWDPARHTREQDLWTEHADFMDALFDGGSIVLAGPLADDSAALTVMTGQSAGQVRRVLDEDPWTIHDILRADDITEWTIYMDGRTRQPSLRSG